MSPKLRFIIIITVIFLVVAILSLGSFLSVAKKETLKKQTPKELELNLTHYLDTNNVITIQNCQYFVTQIRFENAIQYIHKGNCNNPIHKCNCK